MPVIPEFNKLFSTRRPFGGAVLLVDEPCNWSPALFGGEFGGQGTDLSWDSWIDFPFSLDVRDAVTRAAGTNGWAYADGDRVDIRSDALDRTYIYVVVWVMERWPGTPAAHRRAYLMRNNQTFP